MKHLTVADIAKLVAGEIIGDGSFCVTGINGIREAHEGELTFVANAKYEALLTQTKASAAIVGLDVTCSSKHLIRVANPSYAFTQVLNHLLPDPRLRHPQGIHPTAIIHPTAKLGANVGVGAYVVIEQDVQVGNGSVIYAGSYIGHGSTLGSDCLIYPQVMIRENITLQDRVIIHSGTVIGSDGFGYVTVNGRHEKIPQIGTVIIESDVEIGANVTIDRARFDKTVIGEGTKIDNLVHIAHNVIVGKHCLIVAQVGISGSSTLGNYVILAGQVGVVGHLTIGDGAIVTAQSGVSKSIKAGEQVFGSPAQPIKDAFRANAHVGRLEHYAATIKDLKKRIEELEKKHS